MGGPAQEVAGGWTPTIVGPGDKIAANFHPLKDGSHGGQLLNIVLANGQQIGRSDAQRNGPQRN